MVQFGDRSGVELREVRTPNVAIPPGGAFEVEFVMFNHSSAIVFDQDGCSNEGTPCSGKDGYCIKATAQVGSGTSTVTKCLNLPVTGVPPNQEVWSTTLTAPESEGQHNVTAYAEASNSGNRSPSTSSSITVSTDSTGASDPRDENGDNDDDGGDGGSNFLAFAKDNPLAAGIGSVAAIVAVREGANTLFGGDD